MIEKTKLEFFGEYKITLYDELGKVVKEYDWEHNEVIANAPIILSRLVGGQPYNLDRIAAIKAGALLYVAEITSVTHPSFEETLFSTIFGLESFNDTLDELQLISSNGGTFSLVPGLNITKTDAQSMGIQWKIKLGFCDNLWIPTTATYGLGSLPIFPPLRINNIGGKDYLIP